VRKCLLSSKSSEVEVYYPVKDLYPLLLVYPESWEGYFIWEQSDSDRAPPLKADKKFYPYLYSHAIAIPARRLPI